MKTMNILLAPDSFKDCLDAAGVARSLEKGILNRAPAFHVTAIPMADGGEGTVQALVSVLNGRLVRVQVMDPLFREIHATCGISGDGSLAVMEMASASGLELLGPGQRDPLRTTTFGTGQLILHALDQGCREILLGIGGSATNDGGMGMAAALGVEFLDVRGKPVRPVGGNLAKVRTIRTGLLDPRLQQVKLQVACDVDNPLTGPQGATLVYGRQKGAGPETLQQLERGMKHLAQLIREQLGMDVEHIPGAGAAGGLGGGLMAFAGARLTGGFDLVARHAGLEQAIAKADVVVTGEGRMDAQTLHGKVPDGVAKLARNGGKKVIAVGGIIEPEARKDLEDAFDHLVSLHDPARDPAWSIRNAPVLLEKAGKEIIDWLGA